MALVLDPITRKKLVLAKQLYQRALVQSAASHSSASRLLTVVIFDLSAETALKAAIRAVNPAKTPPDNFDAVIQQANDAFSKAGVGAVPDEMNIRNVHGIRNRAQHEATYPNEADVNDCRTYTRDFLRNLCSSVWQVDFDTLTLTELVTHKETHRHLADAEPALDRREYKEAAKLANAGLHWALLLVRGAIVGRSLSFARSFVMDDSLRAYRSGSSGRDAFTAFE